MTDFTLLIQQYVNVAERLLQYVGGRRSEWEYDYSEFWNDNGNSTKFRDTILEHLKDAKKIQQSISNYIIENGDTKKPSGVSLSASEFFHFKEANDEPYTTVSITKYIPISPELYEKYNNAIKIFRDIERVIIVNRYIE